MSAGVRGPVGVVGGGGGGGVGVVVVVVVVGGGVVTGTVVVVVGVVVGVGFVRTAAPAFGVVVRATDCTGADDATDTETAGAIVAAPRDRAALCGCVGAAGA